MFLRYNAPLDFWEYDASAGSTGEGPWVILPLNASYLLGSVPPGSLPPNIAYTDLANVFTNAQTIYGGNPSLYLTDPTQPVNQRIFRLMNQAQQLRFYIQDDGESGHVAVATLSRNGNLNVVGTIAAGANVTANNAITAGTTITAGGAITCNPILTVNGPTNPEVDLFNTTNSLLFRLLNYLDRFQVYYNPIGPLFQVDIAGNTYATANIYEKGRTTPVGHWIDVPFSAGNFAGTGGMAWTVTAAQVPVNRYTVIGKTLIWSLIVDAASFSGTPANAILAALPTGFTYLRSQTIGSINSGAWTSAILQAAAGVPYITIYKEDTGNYTIGTMYLTFTATFPIQ